MKRRYVRFGVGYTDVRKRLAHSSGSSGSNPSLRTQLPLVVRQKGCCSLFLERRGVIQRRLRPIMQFSPVYICGTVYCRPFLCVYFPFRVGHRCLFVNGNVLFVSRDGRRKGPCRYFIVKFSTRFVFGRREKFLMEEEREKTNVRGAIVLDT